MIERTREKFRAPAPEIDVDVAIVAKHCEHAERLKTVRDFALGVFSVVALVSVFPAILDRDPNLVPTSLILIVWLVGTIITMIEAIANIRAQRKFARARAQTDQTTASTLTQTNNVVIYSGFSPFVGSGADLGGWSLAVDVERSKQDITVQKPQTFDLADLYAHVGGALERLHMPDLRLTRKLFVDGRCIRENHDFLPEIYRPPVSRVDDNVIRSYASRDCKGVRHYLCAEVIDWEGEVVVSQFIHFRQLPTKLFVELSAFLLPPLKSEFYEIDRLHPELKLKDYFGILVASVIQVPFLLAFCPFILWAKVSRVLNRSATDRRVRREIDEDLLFDYGSKQSLRELATSTQWRVYFQKLDKEMYQKILQQQFIDSLVDFLDAHGIDTSEIKERALHILNNGVIMSGGSINAQGLAVGKGAQSTVQQGREQAKQ